MPAGVRLNAAAADGPGVVAEGERLAEVVLVELADDPFDRGLALVGRRRGLHPDRQLDARCAGVVEPALALGDHDDAGLVVAVAVGRGVDAVVLEVRRGRRVRLGVLGADVVGEQRLIRVDEDDSVDLGVPLRGRARHEPGTARTEATATPCLVTASYGM
jgi:hypothetical protein